MDIYNLYNKNALLGFIKKEGVVLGSFYYSMSKLPRILHSPFSSTMRPSGGFSSFLIAHEFSCASCTEVGSGSGSTANTDGMTVTSASMAAARIVVFIG
jgi:hypothetical protein